MLLIAFLFLFKTYIAITLDLCSEQKLENFAIFHLKIIVLTAMKNIILQPWKIAECYIGLACYRNSLAPDPIFLHFLLIMKGHKS